MTKIGIIGWGYWGRNYAKYFDAKLGAQLTHVCDVRPDMLSDAKHLYPHLVVTKKITDLVDARLDGVVLASPASLHFALAKIFIEAKIPILIEKPLTDSLKSATLLERIAKSNNTKVLVGHTFIYNQAVRYLKNEIVKGTFGKLQYFEFRRQSYGPIRDDVNVIWDFAPHDIAIIDYLLGGMMPTSVYAQTGKYSRNSKGDIAIIILRYPNNIMVNINVAWLFPIKLRVLTLLGDKAMGVFEDVNKSEPVKIYDISLKYPNERDPQGASFRLGDVHIPRILQQDPLSLQLKHFVEYIKGKAKALTPISSGVRVVRILELIQKSIHMKKEI